MNIKVEDHLLVNKKLKLKEQNSNTTNTVAQTAPVDGSKAGMNALMFQGMNNIVNDPQLATELKLADKIVPEQENKAQTAEEYVAPFKSNLAFQGKASKFKTATMALLMGLATMAGSSALQSCEKEYLLPDNTEQPEINVTVTVDFSAITALQQQMLSMWQQMLDMQKITNEQLTQNNEMFKKLIEMFQQGQTDANEFYAKMYEFIMTSKANQEIIIELLVQNGMEQEQANNFLEKIYNEVKSGNLSATEAMDKIMKELGEIKGILAQTLQEFQKYAEESLRNQKDLIYVNKQGFREMAETGKITNETLEMITKQNEEFQKTQEKQIENQNKILEAIEKANLDSNANFDKVLETLNVNKKDLIGVLVQIGLRQEQIEKMTASQIIAAIKENTRYTERGNKMLIQISEQLAILPEMKEQGKVTNEQLKQFYETYKEVSNNQGQYSKEMLDKMQVLLDQMKEISGTLDEINAKLSEMMQNFQDFAKKSLQNQQDMMSINKQGFEEVINNGKISAQTLVKIAEQNDKLQQSMDVQTKTLNEIKDAIVKTNLDNNAKFDELVNVLNVRAKDIIGVMVQLGLSQEEVMKMNKSEIVAAINDNTNMIQKGFSLLVKISEQIADLPNRISGGTVDKTELEKIYALIKEVSNSNGQYTKELISKMEVLLDKLTNIQVTLDQILQQVTKLSNDFNKFRAEYSDNKKVEFKLLEELVKDNKIQNSVLVQMSGIQKEMLNNLNGIDKNVNSLLVIAKDDSKHQELINAIKNIQGGGSGSANIDYDRLEAMFKAMGMQIADVVNMSSTQLQQAIKNFQNTYVKTEKESLNVLTDISSKLDDLQYFQGLNKNEIVNAINKVNQSVQQGNEDITVELKQIQDAIEVVQAQLNSIYKEVADIASLTNAYFQRWDNKFDSVLNSLENFKGQLSTIISNQKTAQVYLNKTVEEINNLKKEIHNLEIAGGGNLDYDKLEQMWQKHDQANFDKYSQLIQNLGIDKTQIKNIEDLLKSIDSKMAYIKQNSDILNKILDKLNSIDWSQPDYNAKLDKIIEILKNFKCNCECGGNNEGILGDLDQILG